MDAARVLFGKGRLRRVIPLAPSGTSQDVSWVDRGQPAYSVGREPEQGMSCSPERKMVASGFLEIKTSAHSRHRNTTIPTISMPSTPKSLHCWYLLVILIAGVLRSVFGPVVPHGNRDFDNRPFISYSGIAFEPHAGDACDAPWTR